MIRRNQKIVFIFLFCAQTLYPQTLKLKWNEFPQAIEEYCLFVGGKSTSDFWISNTQGKLFHWNGKSYQLFSPPNQKKILAAYYLQIANSTFLCAVADRQYRTKFYLFKDGKWKAEYVELPTRTQNLLKCSDGKIYICGDWGALIKYDNGKWERIITPFKNHIINFIENNAKDYWLSVRGEGIFRFDGVSFKKVTAPAELEISIVSLKVVDNEVFAATDQQQVLKFINDEMKPVSSSQLQLLDVYKKGLFGFTAVDEVLESGKRVAFDFPKHFKIVHHGMIDDTTVILLSSNGRVYVGTPRETGYFVNLTNLYDIATNPDYNTLSSSFYDLNNDRLQDIFIFNPQPEKRSRIFLNKFQQPMEEVSEWIEPIIFKGTSQYILSDINKDNRTDFVLTRLDTIGLAIELYEQGNDNNYSRSLQLSDKKLFNRNKLSEVRTFDYDGDGDIDIALTYYFDQSMQKGNLVFLNNSWWGSSFKVDTSFIYLTGGWNIQSIFAELNGDNSPELYIINRWGKNHILQNQNGAWKDLDSTFTGVIANTTLFDVSLSDFDVDGDLDIIGISLSSRICFFRNEGKLNFSDQSEKYFPPAKNNIPDMASRLTIGDINNDGFPDIIMSNKKGNHLLINQGGKSFKNVTDEYGLTNSVSNETIIGDIDNDGDLDLFSYGDGGNTLWVNTQNDSNYLKIIPQGIVSNSEGKNAIIWIYESGHLSNPNYLRGYQQCGINLNTANVVHFGLSSEKTYDVKVQFRAGKERILNNVHTGQLLVVKEIEGPYAEIYRMPGMAFRFLKNSEVHWYALFICCALILLASGARYGSMNFAWGAKALFFFLTLNLLVYWGISALTVSSVFIVKYFIPLSMILLGVTMPNIIYYWARSRHQTGKTEEELQYELLQAVVEFMHGEWTMRSLNSLILYCNDMAEVEKIEPAMSRNYQERRTAFIEMTQPRLIKICNLGKQIKHQDTIVEELRRQLVQVVSTLTSNDKPTKETLHSAGVSLQSFKNILVSYRDNIISSHSCEPFEVVKSVISALQPEKEQTTLPIAKLMAFTNKCHAIIHNYELADILDNNIRNAKHAIANNKNGIIEIILYRSSPKICIDITDNGIGIAKDKIEQVFERGYSEHGGTGLGLAMSRTILQKYGGRIFIKNSETGIGTTFTIELNEAPLT